MKITPIRPSIPSGTNTFISVIIGYRTMCIRSRSYCIFALESQTFPNHSPSTTLLNTAVSCAKNIISLTGPLLWHVCPFFSFVRESCSNPHFLRGCVNSLFSALTCAHSSLRAAKRNLLQICFTTIFPPILVSIAHKFTNNFLNRYPSTCLNGAYITTIVIKSSNYCITIYFYLFL